MVFFRVVTTSFCKKKSQQALGPCMKEHRSSIINNSRSRVNQDNPQSGESALDFSSPPKKIQTEKYWHRALSLHNLTNLCGKTRILHFLQFLLNTEL